MFIFNKTFLIISTIFPALLFNISCSKNKEEPIIAAIGEYELRISDFKKASKRLSEVERQSIKTMDGKLAFMEQLIDRQVLLQEAQRLNIDKRKNFMYRIESFWEEALLEELVEMQSMQLMQNIQVSQKEIQSYYNKMQRKIQARVVVINSKEIAKKILENKTISVDEEFEIIKDSKIQWFRYDELDMTYRDILFSMKAGEKKMFLKPNKGWFVFFIYEYKNMVIEDKDALIKRITSIIKDEKDLKAIDDWINSLRVQTPIQLNRDVLEYVEVE